MKFEWDEGKNEENLRKHELDFAYAHEVFELPMLVAATSAKGMVKTGM